MKKIPKLPKIINGRAIASLIGIKPKIKTSEENDRHYLIEGDSVKERREDYDVSVTGKRIAAAVMLSFFSVIIQEAFFNDLRLWGVKPNIAIVTVMIIASLSEPRFSMLYGLFTGLFIDIAYGKVLGLYALLFMFAAVVVSAIVRYDLKGRIVINWSILAPSFLIYGFAESFFARLLTIYSSEHNILYYNFAEHILSRILPQFAYNLIVSTVMIIPLTLLWSVLGKFAKKGLSFI